MTIQKTLFAGAVLFSPFFSSSGLGQQDPQAEVIGLLEMVEIPAGTFRMGCVEDRECEFNEEPVREVSIQPFRLSRYEVTFAQYDIFCQATNSRCPEDEGWGRGDRPVINVSWADAQVFIAWLNQGTDLYVRLPTEAEWEYAARAGTNTSYPWGNLMEQGVANCSQDCGDEFIYTAPVGQFPSNAFGLHDMHGNVFEWVEDCWSETYEVTGIDGSAVLREVCMERVHRGGSWVLSALGLRSANRDFGMTRFSHIYRMKGGGFRLAQDVP